MALRSLSRVFPAGLLRQGSPASRGRLMSTRSQAIQEEQAAAALRQEFTDFQEKTRRDLDRLTKYANILNKAANVTVGVAIVGAPLLLTMGSEDQA